MIKIEENKKDDKKALSIRMNKKIYESLVDISEELGLSATTLIAIATLKDINMI